VYRALASQGRLPLSVLMMPHAATLLSNEPPERGDAPATGEGTEELRVGPQKLFADGGVAIALDVAIGGQPVRYGIAFRDVVGRIEDAVERGFRVAVHAIGNAGLALALEGFGRVDRRWPDDDHRFRVEHVGVCDRAQVAALADLGALGVVQPGFVEHVAAQTGGVRFDDHHWLAFGDLAEAGVGLAGSSDDPCAPFPPLWCAARGDTRSTTGGLALEPGQRVPFADWLSAYTTGGAFAGGQEAERGSITPGKRADLVVLSGALLPEPLPTVDETWVAGECRYRR
jgi:hypothetical protein